MASDSKRQRRTDSEERIGTVKSHNSQGKDVTLQRFMTEGSDNAQYSKIPNNLSNWERKHLEKLSIKVSFQPETPPLQLICRKIQKTGLQVHEVLKMQSDEEEMKVASLVRYVQQSKFIEMLAKINYTTFDSLSRNTLKGVDMYADDRYMCSFIPDGLPEGLKLWFYRFHTHGKMFAYILHKMVENKDEGLQIYECHFKHLFDTFVKMFGMLSGINSFAPCLQTQKMAMMGTEVSGAPDIVYSCHSLKPHLDNEMRSSCVVAICDVKTEKPVVCVNKNSPENCKVREKTEKKSLEEACSSSVTSTSASLENKCVPHMSDKLIGQHGGELLLNYQQSNRCDLIIGMVVQETHVTFTALEITEYQYQRIKDGVFKCTEKDRPILTFTKAYDYLKYEDLECIIEAFIRLGIEQNK